MAQAPDIQRVLYEHLHNPSSSFSIGSFGAIAEFHRRADEPLALDDPARLTVATERGGLKVELIDDVRPLAYETLSGRRDRWQHGVVFCLPKALAASSQRGVLTELGPDRDAIRPEDRDAILFDMGLAARNVDFCIRTKDASLLAVLRQGADRPLFEHGNPAMGAILEANPHRIAISKLGRAEVYQAIGKVKTPEGPHTHVLPKFLKSGRTHSANIPVPRGQLPCLSLHPAHPLYDGLGQDTPFEPNYLTSFEALLDYWGAPEYRAEKARVVQAVRGGQDAQVYELPRSRLGRTGLRVALRQLKQLDGDTSALRRWRDRCDVSQARRAAKAAVA